MDTRYREDVKDFLDELLLPIPGVKGGKAFGYPAYKINGKVFAFFGGTAISLKLPTVRARALINSQPGVMRVFEPAEGIIWKEWLTIQRAAPGDYEQDVPLFEEWDVSRKPQGHPAPRLATSVGADPVVRRGPVVVPC